MYVYALRLRPMRMNTVKCRYNVVQFFTMLHTALQWQWQWDDCCKDNGENWPCYNEIALYIVKEIPVITLSFPSVNGTVELDLMLFHPRVCHTTTLSWTIIAQYRKTSNISRTLVGNKIVDNSDVVGASPVGAAPTTSSFST